MAKNYLSVNSLMSYLRNTHNISIKGSRQKRTLRNIGYYHGYKGYRFFSTSANRLPYSDFDQLTAVYEFDMCLKTLFYTQIMFFETALKNLVLEIILSESKSNKFSDIYSMLLTGYMDFNPESGRYETEHKKRLELQNKIYGGLSYSYSTSSRIVKHFLHKDDQVPIWAIFELISLGEFGTFVSCLKLSVRKLISVEFGINQAYDTNAKMVNDIIYAIKDLRNAIAHNDIIFDTRFKRASTPNALQTYLGQNTNIAGIDFCTIVDYLILIVYVSKLFKVPKRDLTKLVSSFDEAIDKLHTEVPIAIYSTILHLDTRNKLSQLTNFIRT